MSNVIITPDPAAVFNVGQVTSYADAVKGGYTGTREEWERDLANLGTTAAEVEANRQEVAEDKAAVQENLTTVETYKNSAEQSASEALQSAENAHTDALAATAAKEAAQTSQGIAEEARTDAVSAKTSAESAQTAANASAAAATEAALAAGNAAQTATAQADAASDSATAAAASAAAAAESARTLTIDTTLTQAGQAADAKKTGDEITDLKSAINLKTFIIPYCLYWGHSYTTRGSTADVPDNTNIHYHEFRLLNNVKSFVKIKVEANELNVQISNNLIQDVVWTDELTFNAGENIRFIVRQNDEADEIGTEAVSYITATMSQEAFDELFSRHELFQHTYSTDEKIIGMALTRVGASDSMPYTNTNNYVSVFYNTSSSISRPCRFFNQTGSVITFTEFNLNDIVSGKAINPPKAEGDFSWVSCLSELTYIPVRINNDYPDYTNIRTVFKRNTRRVDAVTYYDNNYYMLGRDKTYLEKVDGETLEATRYPDLAAVGHINGSNLLNGKWYVAAGSPPETITVYDLTQSTPTKSEITFPILEYYPDVTWAAYQPITDSLWYSLSNTDTSSNVLIAWYKLGDNWIPCHVIDIPRIGLMQDFIIIDNIAYIPISKKNAPNQYLLIGMIYVNLNTQQIILSQNKTTYLEEPEAIFDHEGAIYIGGATGTIYYCPKYDFNWNDYPPIYISPSDFDWN